jgi:propanediol dehydratase small subunit
VLRVASAPGFERRRIVAAAALCAAADQADAANVPNYIRGDAYWAYRNGRAAAKEHLIAIADELEGTVQTVQEVLHD